MGKRVKLQEIKILDIQWGDPKMPRNVKNFFFEEVGYLNPSNGVWVKYTVGCKEEEFDEDAYDDDYDSVDDYLDDESGFNILDEWLLENTNVEEGEEILLKHWW